MSDKDFTIADMISAAKGESPSEFQTAFDSLIVDRIAKQVDAARQEVAKNYFNTDDEQSAETQEVTTDENTEASAGSETGEE